MTGTSSGKEKQVVVDIECSAECTDITATGTDLRPPSGTAEYVCANVESTDEVRGLSPLQSNVLRLFLVAGLYMHQPELRVVVPTHYSSLKIQPRNKYTRQWTLS